VRVAIAVLAGGYVPSKKDKKVYVINCTPGWTDGLVGNIAIAQTSWDTCYQKAAEIAGGRSEFDVLVGEGQRSTIVGGMANRTFAQHNDH
jgi:hypothetical protein